MLHIGGQTAGPIGLNFFVDTHGWSAGVLAKKYSKLFFPIFFNFLFKRQRPGLSAIIHLFQKLNKNSI